SSGMRDALRVVKPTQFEDLIALVALYRPGPMQYIPEYAKRKNGQVPVTYIDPRLEAITGVSHGICIYQEQYLEIAKHIAGFTPAEADDLRKAIGKKIHELMASLKEKFVEGQILFGLNAVKNVGDAAAREIVDSRGKSGTFGSLWDFTERVNPQVVNKRALESLINCGAFDSTGGSRRGMLEAVEKALGSGAKLQEDLFFGQESMFKVEHPAISDEEFEKNELLRREKETLGLYI